MARWEVRTLPLYHAVTQVTQAFVPEHVTSHVREWISRIESEEGNIIRAKGGTEPLSGSFSEKHPPNQVFQSTRRFPDLG